MQARKKRCNKYVWIEYKNATFMIEEFDFIPWEHIKRTVQV